jgi:Mrp family chromosome partitioning ATPase
MRLFNLPARLGSRGILSGTQRHFGGTDIEPIRSDAASGVGDEFRLIKHQLVERALADTGRNRDARVIMVTSALPGEGKTYVALNLAISLSLERGAAVTLIDCNVDDQRHSARFSNGRGPGLLDYLDNPSIGIERVLVSSSVPNVDIISLGDERDDGIELINSSAMSTLLRSLTSRGGNGYVIIDTGAVLAGGSATAVAQNVGQVVFVIEKDRTRRLEVEESLSLLERIAGAVNDRWVGLVFNKADPSESLARYRNQ